MRVYFTDAAELRAFRAAAGWTQKDLASRTGIHVQSVKYHERRTGPIGGHAPRLFREALDAAGITALPKVLDPGRLTCGAKTRAGGVCHAHPIEGKGRCRFHGGKSTGPRTAEGRKRISEAQRLRWHGRRAVDPAA